MRLRYFRVYSVFWLPHLFLVSWHFVCSILVAGSPYVITISGQSFSVQSSGFTAAVTVGGKACALVTQAHTVVTCNLPAGEGQNQEIVLKVSTFTSNVWTSFSYGSPVVNDVSPLTAASTAGGSSLAINGVNFGTTSSVLVGGNNCPVTQRTHILLVCTVPAGQGASTSVVVSLGQQQSNSQFVASVYGRPTFASSDSILPVSGQTAGGYAVTISGSNFGTFGSVKFGSGSTFYSCDATTTSWSHTRIVCTLTTGQGQGLNAHVTVSGAFAMSSATFSYSAPTISSLSPSSGTTAGGTALTIAGNNFGVSPTAIINFASISRSFACTSPMILQVTSTSQNLICVTSEGYGSGGLALVSVGGQSTTSSATFSYNAPTLADITPDNGMTSGGYRMTITGTSFGTAGTVTVGGSACSVTAYSHSQIVCTVPAGTGAVALVRVTSTASSLSSTNTLTFAYLPPVISDTSPNTLPTGPTSAGLLTITGSNFGLGVAAVTIGGVSCPLEGATQTHSSLVCRVAVGTGMGKQISVTVNGQSTTFSGTFAYSPPTLTSTFVPAFLPTAGAAMLTLAGSSFGQTVSAVSVTIGASPCVVQSASHTQITCTAPPGIGVSLSIFVKVDGQISSSQLISYSAPQISSVTPTVGSTAGGYTVTLTGSNFGASGSGNLAVSLSGVPCPVTLQSDTQIQCTVGSGQDVNNVFSLTVGAQTSNTKLFSFSPPSVSSISPQQGTTLVCYSFQPFLYQSGDNITMLCIS